MKDEYNDGYTHEALHSAHIALDLWRSHVLETRCADQFPEVRAAAEEAEAAMHKVYQLIGQKFDGGPICAIDTDYDPSRDT